MFLAGDLGGTKTLLAEYVLDGDGLREVSRQKYTSRSDPSFDDILADFLNGRSEALASACFGVAGTVVQGRSHATNLPWSLGEQQLAEKIGVPRVKLLNDLEATALGMLVLPAGSLTALAGPAPTGQARAGNVGVIAAGTGLGEAMLYWDGKYHHAVASEGGHADFAPTSDREVELWRYLRGRFGEHVSYERVLSGPGLKNIYDFLKDDDPAAEPSWLTEELNKADASAVIASHGLKGDVPICLEALAIFVVVYGAAAGNLALRYVATGGVFLAGGIAPKILPALQSNAFLASFRAKGRLSSLLDQIPVFVSLEPSAALLGAAHYATRL
jgi:glucokinase